MLSNDRRAVGFVSSYPRFTEACFSLIEGREVSAAGGVAPEGGGEAEGGYGTMKGGGLLTGPYGLNDVQGWRWEGEGVTLGALMWGEEGSISKNRNSHHKYVSETVSLNRILGD